MEQQVMIMGETACEGVAQSIRARERDVAVVGTELEEVGRGLDVFRGVIEKPKPKP